MENKIKVGDTVTLISIYNHNSKALNWNDSIYFSADEKGKIITILDIEKDTEGELAYKVECNKGITYLRKKAFEFVESKNIHIQQFITNTDLVIQCDTLEQAKIAGKYLWPQVNVNGWSPYDSVFPIIMWYSSKNAPFNKLSHLRTNQKVYHFENIIFEDVSYNYLIPYINKL